VAKYYSKTQMKALTIEDENGDIRIYKGFKLNAKTLLTESFKLLKTVMPALGTVADGYNNQDLMMPPQTYTAAAQMLENNLSEDHFEDLVDKLTGNLICNGDAVDNWDKHFDEYVYDLPEVIAWAGRENFADFFIRNHLVRSKLRLIKSKMSPAVQEILSKILDEDSSKSKDTSGKSGNDI
jgi:hypothetical protein